MKLREKIAMAALLASLNVLSAEAQDVHIGQQEKPRGFGRKAKVERSMDENGNSIVTIVGRQNQSARLVVTPANNDELMIVAGSVFVPHKMKKGDKTQRVEIIEVAQRQNSDIMSGKIIEKEFDLNGTFLKDNKNQDVPANVALQTIRNTVYGPVIE